MNETHDPLLRSGGESANVVGGDFPIQNLPFGMYRPAGSAERFRGGVAIGDSMVDLEAALARRVFTGAALEAATLAAQSSLNALMSAGPAAASALRLALSRALRAGSSQRAALESALVPQSAAQLGLPAQI